MQGHHLTIAIIGKTGLIWGKTNLLAIKIELDGKEQRQKMKTPSVMSLISKLNSLLHS